MNISQIHRLKKDCSAIELLKEPIIDLKIKEAADFRWAQKAETIDDYCRLMLSGTYWDAESGMIVCSDGKRMHVANIDPGSIPLPSGTYLPVFTDGSKDWKDCVTIHYKNTTIFPNYKKILPDMDTLKSRGKDSGEKILKIAYSIGLFNIRFLEDLDLKREWEVFSRDDSSNHAVLFKSDNRAAVIMPMAE